jgi:hypothetical protein
MLAVDYPAGRAAVGHGRRKWCLVIGRRCYGLTVGAAVLVLALGDQVRAAKPDFSGTWVLDLAKSQFASMQPPDAIALTILHKEPIVVLSSIRRIGRIETSNRLNLNTDGAPVSNEIETPDGRRKTQSTSKWVGDRLVTTYRVPHIGHFDDFRDTWDLSDDGTVLTILREASLPDTKGSVRRYVISMVHKRTKPPNSSH